MNFHHHLNTTTSHSHKQIIVNVLWSRQAKKYHKWWLTFVCVHGRCQNIEVFMPDAPTWTWLFMQLSAHNIITRLGNMNCWCVMSAELMCLVFWEIWYWINCVMDETWKVFFLNSTTNLKHVLMSRGDDYIDVCFIVNAILPRHTQMLLSYIVIFPDTPKYALYLWICFLK
jgi:hypothetical protein